MHEKQIQLRVNSVFGLFTEALFPCGCSSALWCEIPLCSFSRSKGICSICLLYPFAYFHYIHYLIIWELFSPLSHLAEICHWAKRKKKKTAKPPVTKITHFLKQSPRFLRKEQWSPVRSSASSLSHCWRLLVLEPQAQGTEALDLGSAGEGKQLHVTWQPRAFDNMLLQTGEQNFGSLPSPLADPFQTCTSCSSGVFFHLQAWPHHPLTPSESTELSSGTKACTDEVFSGWGFSSAAPFLPCFIHSSVLCQCPAGDNTGMATFMSIPRAFVKVTHA